MVYEFMSFLSHSLLIHFVVQMSLSPPLVSALLSGSCFTRWQSWIKSCPLPSPVPTPGVQDTLTPPPSLIPPKNRNYSLLLVWFWFVFPCCFSELNWVTMPWSDTARNTWVSFTWEWEVRDNVTKWHLAALIGTTHYCLFSKPYPPSPVFLFSQCPFT